MNRKNMTGIRLVKKQDDRNKNTCFFSFITALLSCISVDFMLTEFSGYQEAGGMILLFLTAVLVCGLEGLAEKKEKKTLFYIVILLLLLVCFFIFRKQILSGCCSLWNRMGERITANTGFAVRELAMPDGNPEGRFVMAALAFAGVMSAVLCCAFNMTGLPVTALFLLGLFLLGKVLVGTQVSGVCSGMVLFASLVNLLSGAGQKEREPKQKGIVMILTG